MCVWQTLKDFFIAKAICNSNVEMTKCFSLVNFGDATSTSSEFNLYLCDFIQIQTSDILQYGSMKMLLNW